MSTAGKTGELLGQIGALAKQGLPPVHLWNPPFCGDIEMRIARDGTWYYQNSPIGRPSMVKLFSTIIRRDGDQYFLVTPVEKCGIQVDVAPFVAVTLEVQGQGAEQQLCFTTNVGDQLIAGPDHPIDVSFNQQQEPLPLIRVRSNLDALIHRSAFYQLVDLAVEREHQGQSCLMVQSLGQWFVLGYIN